MAVINGTIVTTDVNPAISIDHIARLNNSIATLQRLFGIMDLKVMADGSQIKQYVTSVGTVANQVSEGDEIGLTKVTRTLAQTITLSLKKYRKLVTAEAIQRDGYENSVNDTDDALIKEVRKAFKTQFYTMLATGTGSGTAGDDLQSTCANLWADLAEKFEDIDATPIFFVNPKDVAAYLGNAAITTQTAFGFDYMVNFLGMGDAIITPKVTQGTVIATAKENLNGAYVPANGDLGKAFGLTADESGLVGMVHTPLTGRASLETLLLMGVAFYAEDLSGVFTATIGESGESGESGATGQSA